MRSWLLLALALCAVVPAEAISLKKQRRLACRADFRACMQAPLVTTTTTLPPIATRTVASSISGGSGVYATATFTVGPAHEIRFAVTAVARYFFCPGSAYTIVQGGAQYRGDSARDGDGVDMCGDIVPGATVGGVLHRFTPPGLDLGQPFRIDFGLGNCPPGVCGVDVP